MCQNDQSPCLNCKRVKNPADCENKNCRDWCNWFYHRWALIHGYYIKYGKEKGEAYELEKRSY